MPKFLISGSYSSEGVQGLLKEGGSARRAVLEKAITSLGGTLETFYYSFGFTDAFAIAELPDNASAAALALQISSTGAVDVSTTVLLSPEEIDTASQRSVDYRPPG